MSDKTKGVGSMPLTGCVIAASGHLYRIKHEEVKTIAESLGAKFVGKDVKDCTHFITTEKTKTSKKSEVAIQKNCTFVTVAWLQACAQSQTKVATLEFEIECYDVFLASLVDSNLVKIDSSLKEEDFRVLVEKGSAYDANFVEFGPMAKTARLQLLYQPSSKSHYLLSYQKTGNKLTAKKMSKVAKGQPKDTFFRSFEKFTGLSWMNRDEAPVQGKFAYFDMIDHESLSCPSKPDSKSRVCDSIREVLKPIIGDNQMSLLRQRTLDSLEANQKVIPTDDQLRAGIGILNLLISPSLSANVRVDLRKRYKKTFSCASPFEPDAPIAVEDMEKEITKLQSLYALRTVLHAPTCSSSSISFQGFSQIVHEGLGLEAISAGKNWSSISINFADGQCYNLVDPSTREYRALVDYFHYQHEIVAIFRIERTGEQQSYDNFQISHEHSIGEKRLLWHGTPVQNLQSILYSGLKPYNDPPGIYFSDLSNISMAYCQGSEDPVALMLLCEVEVGKWIDHGTFQIQPGGSKDAHPRIAFHMSTAGRKWRDAGIVHPDLKGVHMLHYETMKRTAPVPYSRYWENKEYPYDEYCVTSPRQVRKRYLFQVRPKDPR